MNMEVEDVRSRVASSGWKLYALAPLVGIHPSTLGKMLRGKLPLRPEICERLRHVLQDRNS